MPELLRLRVMVPMQGSETDHEEEMAQWEAMVAARSHCLWLAWMTGHGEREGAEEVKPLAKGQARVESQAQTVLTMPPRVGLVGLMGWAACS